MSCCQSWKAAWGTLFWRHRFDKISLFEWSGSSTCSPSVVHQMVLMFHQSLHLWYLNRIIQELLLPSSLPSFFLFFIALFFTDNAALLQGGKQKNHRGDCWIMQTAPQNKPLSSVFGSILLYFSLLDSITVSSETALSHTLSLLSLTALLPSVDCARLARIDPAHRQIWIGQKSMAAPLSCSCDRAQSPHRNMWAACCAADAAFKQSNWLFAPWDHQIRRSKMAKTN